MKLQRIYRNYITTLIVGKYNIDKISNNALLKDEEYISSIDILFYDEVLVIMAALLSVVIIYLSQFSILFLSFLVFPVLLFYFAIQVEIIILTSERVLMEIRGLIEKILRVKNIRSISIDQIAIFSYARAPFNYAALAISFIGVVFLLEIFDTPLNLSEIGSPGIVLSMMKALLIISLLYLIWYGLRLSKRSIEMSIIGISRAIGIGRRKGAPQWFVNDMEMMIYDRIHHIYHSENTSDLKIEDFPLAYNSNVKALLRQTQKPVQRKILEQLVDSSLSKNRILQLVRGYSKIEIDEAMRQLRKIQFIFYDRSRRIWCLNSQYIQKRSNEIQLDASLVSQIYPSQGNEIDILAACKLLGVEWVIEQVGIKRVVEEIGLTNIIQEVDLQHLIEELLATQTN